MSIQRVKVSNFKSFDELEVELRPFNLVVGANAAGKSNFLEIFRFLRDLAAEGLANAVSLQGGMGYLANLNTRTDRILVEAEIANPDAERLLASRGDFEAVSSKLLDSTYRIWFRAGSPGTKTEILKEEVSQNCRFIHYNDQGQSLLLKELGAGKLSWSRTLEESIALDTHLSFSNAELADSWEQTLLEALRHRSQGLGSNLLLVQPRFNLQPALARISLFDLEPKRSKTAHSIRGRSTLDSDGSNLSIVLREILQYPERRESFLRLLKDLLPFAEGLEVEEFPDRSLLIALGERFGDLRSMPASFLSDGTLSLLALLVVLFFDDSPLVVIEEPEKNIHPHLISRLVSLMKEASRHKQLIVTTHNPQLLRHADLEDLLLVQRDAAGFSRISRPADSQEVRTFVENDLGVDELFVQNLLGVGNEV